MSTIVFQLTKSECVMNEKIKTYTESVEGKAMFCIVREFLEFFDLGFTISVYEPESCMGARYNFNGKFGILKDLGLSEPDENSQGPLLLHLIRLVQLNNNTLSKSNSGHNENDKYSETNITDSIKTETSNENGGISTSASDIVYSNDDNEQTKLINLDATFNVSNPKIAHNESVTVNTDANNGKSSVDEQIVNGCEFNRDETFNVLTSEESEKDEESTTDVGNLLSKSNLSLIPLNNKHINVMDLESSSPIVKETKLSSKTDISAEKVKKPDKLKSKGNLCSLADLPPIQLNKSRSNDPMILPSLYTHEFKEKTNMKELDEFLGVELDPMDNYEEDFMSPSEAELFSDRSNLLQRDLSTEETNKLTKDGTVCTDGDGTVCEDVESSQLTSQS